MTVSELILVFLLFLGGFLLGSTQKDLEQTQAELQQYQYATQYLVEHHEDYLLEFCLDGMSEAIEKGFIQSQPPKLMML